MASRPLIDNLRHVANVALVRDAEALARRYSSVDAAEVRALAASAARRVHAAAALTSPRDMPIAGVLFRDAIELRLRAANVGRLERERMALDESARALIATDFEREGAERCREIVASLAHVERELRCAAEPRTLTAIRGVRFGRIAALAVGLAYVLYAVGSRALGPPNVAFHKRVVVTGAVLGLASDLVDGEVDGAKPVRVVGSPPAIDIDLGGEYRIAAIRITNRQDEHFDAALPLYVSTAGSDGAWSDLAVQQIHFRTLSLDAGGRVARYVRVASNGRELGLNEIEVFGRYAR